MDVRRQVGAEGEDAAIAYLVARGWRLVARNVRYPEGEIDAILARDGVLNFVEVKTRRSYAAGHGAEAVTPAKQARIRRVAMRYLAEHKPRTNGIRFDVVELRSIDGSFSVRHLEAAF